MRKGHFIFETVLAIITAIFGLVALVSSMNSATPSDSVYLGALWLLVLGIAQVIHSFIMGGLFWRHLHIRKYLFIYWALSALDLIALYVNDETSNNSNLEALTILVFPLCLTAYLWFISYRVWKTVSSPMAKSLRLD